ncbi:hypothetical protein KAI30_01795, partial [Candidatus Bathyarchaeota archaeon]|nr:hypothetical protein [Candidatus Bathyarchaeota archaeon]
KYASSSIDTHMPHVFCHFHVSPIIHMIETVGYNAIVLNSLFKFLNSITEWRFTLRIGFPMKE